MIGCKVLQSGIDLNTKYAKAKATMVASQYVHGGLAIEFITDDPISEPLARASVYVDGVTRYLKPNQFVCKSYSENEGMLQFFLSSGLAKVATGHAAVRVGYEVCRVLELSPELSAKLQGN